LPKAWVLVNPGKTTTERLEATPEYTVWNWVFPVEFSLSHRSKVEQIRLPHPALSKISFNK